MKSIAELRSSPSLGESRQVLYHYTLPASPWGTLGKCSTTETCLQSSSCFLREDLTKLLRLTFNSICIPGCPGALIPPASASWEPLTTELHHQAQLASHIFFFIIPFCEGLGSSWLRSQAVRRIRIKIADQDRQVVQATNSGFPLQRLRTLYFRFHTTSGKVAVEKWKEIQPEPRRGERFLRLSGTRWRAAPQRYHQTSDIQSGF